MLKRYVHLGPSTVWQAVEKLVESSKGGKPKVGRLRKKKRLSLGEATGLAKWLLYERSHDNGPIYETIGSA
jgi:hypothetical protein